MTKPTQNTKHIENPRRRRALQSVAAAAAVVVAPTLSASVVRGNKGSGLTGELVCKISDPVKTLIIRNHTNKTVVLDHMSKGALMFDGSIVDCNNAFLDQAVSIPANDEIKVQFSKLHSHAISHKVEDFQRVQSRVKRLADGTRVIPFSAEIKGSGAMFA